MCPIIDDRYSNTRLKSHDPNGPDFREVSGLAFSPTQKNNGKPIFFAISDGGGDARIGIFDSQTGKRLRTLRVDRGFFRNSDWEALTIGSCGKSGEGDNCLYIMDAGDNTARQNNGNRGRGNYRILKIREPRWRDYNDNDYISKSRMSRMDFDYRHNSSPTNHADCEAMFLDHKGWGSGEDKGDIYLVTKWDKGNERSKNRLFRLPADAWSSGYNGAVRNYSVKAVGNYDYNRYQRNGGMHIMKTTWSSGEMSFDGTMIALGNLQKSYIFLRCPGTSVKDAIANPSAKAKSCVSWTHPATGQVETLAWTSDRRYTLDIPEGNSPKLGWTKLRFDRNRSSRVCPTPASPTRPPTRRPTPQPTRNPTPRPTRPPTRRPTREPTPNPTPEPTREPTPNPTPEPTRNPTPNPTPEPTTPPPTFEPSTNPTRALSIGPTNVPSLSPTMSPSVSSNPTTCTGHIFDLILQTDQYGANTQWKLYNGFDEVVGEGSGYSRYSTIRTSRCVEPGLHSFEISNEFVDGVPGLYQIWYDKVLVYDSQGSAGSFTQILIGTELDDSSFVPKTPSPTQAPTETTDNEIFGVSCGGICPGIDMQLANEKEVVSIGRNGGTEYFCGTLDKRYEFLFSTPEACEDLQISAQEAGCLCENSLVAGTSIGQVTSNVTEQETMEARENESQSVGTQWGLILGVAAALCIAGFCCYKCYLFSGNSKSAEADNLVDANIAPGKDKDEGSAGETNKTTSDDSTAISGSDESSEMVMTAHESDELRPLPLLKTTSGWGLSGPENGRLQSLPLRKVRTSLGVRTPKNVGHQPTSGGSDITEEDALQAVPLKRAQTGSPKVVSENAGDRIVPLRRVQSALSLGFLQSWHVTMPEGETDHSEHGSYGESDRHQIDESKGGSEVRGDDGPGDLPVIMSESCDESITFSQPDVEMSISSCSDGSALIMSA